MEVKIKNHVAALAGLAPLSLIHAAALDRSTQPSWAFTEDGTFAYIEGINISPDVSGTDKSGNKIPNLTNDHHFQF